MTRLLCIIAAVIGITTAVPAADTFEVKYLSTENVYLNAGSKDGLAVGARLSVIGPQGVKAELEEIKRLLETIRKANLEKNIDLFMSCYASDFGDREGKRKDVLGTWKDFTYQDLNFDLSSESVSGETAHARVAWLSQISSARGGKPQESRTLLEVSFKREENGWKIRETKVIE